ncbi:hypothetical protein DEM27_31890 [Metarhizobium album]|uniref:DUF4376 domain-containing protein n=1 Tax=Metarhizobium album TaxID=2182425 RepID=A0A2U2DG82_9HYPH|nr:hypothetical protein [Rhizobium album]PWE52251.1 hypothetical protein DEM27_31890 [Rhizobium album]
MTLYHEQEPDIFVAWRGQPIPKLIEPEEGEAYEDLVTLPLSIEYSWSDDELSEVSLYRPAPADPVPGGKVVASTSVQRVDGVVKFVDMLADAPPPPTDDINAEHDRRAATGRVFAVAGYGDVALEGSAGTQMVLLALKDTARDMVTAGYSAPVLLFTDRDNVDHHLTPEQVIALVDAGKIYMQALHAAKRALKAMEPIPADYADDQWWP